MATRILRFPLSEWLEPEAVFLAAFADEPYVAGWTRVRMPRRGVSVIAAATDGSRFATASVADGTVSVGRPGEPPVTGRATSSTRLRRLWRVRRPPAEASGGDRLLARLDRLARVRVRCGGERGAGVADTCARCGDAVRRTCRRLRPRDANDRIDRARRAGAAAWAGDLRSRLTASVVAGACVRARGAETRRPARSTPAVATRRRRPTWRLIGECQEAIRRGDAYQLCLTNEATVDVLGRPDRGVPPAACVESDAPRWPPQVRRRRTAERLAGAVPLDHARAGASAPSRSKARGRAARRSRETSTCAQNSRPATRNAPRTS